MTKMTAKELNAIKIINPVFTVRRKDVDKAKAKIQAQGMDAKFNFRWLYYAALTIQTAMSELYPKV